MAIRHYKKISELDAITSASLSTYVAGVDNGQTVRITLDVLADGVRNTINTIDIQRLNALEAATGSYLTSLDGAISGSSQLTSSYDERYTLSGSVQNTILPDGLISSSTQISDFGFISSSHTDITQLNSYTSSQDILNTAFTNAISARLQTTTYNTDSASFNARIIAATNEQSFNGLISGSSQLTSSFDQRYVLSGSITQTTWDNIANKPNDIVSSSTQIADLGFVTGSYAYLTEFNSLTQSFNIISGSVVNITNAVDVTQLNNTTASLNNFTSSYYTDSASFNSRIIAATNEQDLSALNSFTSSQSALNIAFTNGMNGRLQTSSFNEFSASIHTEIVAATNEQSLSHLVTTSSFNSFTQSYNTDSSSFDTRINAVSSGSISVINDIIYNGETFTIQKGTPLYVSGSHGANPKVYVADASNPNKMPVTYIAAANINSNNTGVGILLGDISGIDLTGYQPGQQVYVAEGGGWSINPPSGSNSIKQFLGVIVKEGNGGKGLVLNPGPATLPNLQTGYLWVGNTNNQATTIASSSFEKTGRNIVSGSSQLTSSFEVRGSGIYSSSAQLPSGIVSGSSQLTSSYDSRYSLSGSVLTSFSQSVDSRLDNVEAFSSSLSADANSSTKILDAFYTSATAWSGSYTGHGGTVKVEANFTIFSTTTGTKTFQLYRDGVIVDSGSFYFNQSAVHMVMPTLYYIGANETGTHTYSVGHNATSDVNDSCNIVVTETFNSLNGGLATTGSNTFRGTNRFETVGGDEGGEIEFGVPQTNTTLQNRVTTDIWQNRYRIFEGSANAKGVHIDLSKAPTGASGEIMWKASGMVNAGVSVTLDDIQARFTTSGGRSLEIRTTGASFTAMASAHTTYNNGSYTYYSDKSFTMSTTFGYPGNQAWGFTGDGDLAVYWVRDTTNLRFWRFTLMVGPGYNNNLILIERLH